jgi:hypothetical protein
MSLGPPAIDVGGETADLAALVIDLGTEMPDLDVLIHDVGAQHDWGARINIWGAQHQ